MIPGERRLGFSKRRGESKFGLGVIKKSLQSFMLGVFVLRRPNGVFPGLFAIFFTKETA
jgi:hypothetical protein